MGEKKVNKPAKKRKGTALRLIKRLIRLVVVLAALGAAALFGLKAYISRQAADAEEAVSYSRAQVVRGEMEDTVYGTGTTSARNQPNILAEAEGTLTELRVAVGDEVKEGDILAVITNEEIDDTITDLEFALWELDDTITGTAAGSKVTTIEAPAAGRLMAIYAQAGDDALAVFRREGALAVISTDGRMKVILRGENSALDLALGESVRVSGPGVDETGTVIDLTQQGTMATITINNDALPMDAEVTVYKQDGRELGRGTLQINKPMAVSSFGGTIESVRAKVGDTVKRAQTLFRLEDSPLTLKLEDLRLQRETAAKDLADAKQQRENLIIIAPCDGTVATLDVSEGDAITSGMLLGSILHGEEMNLTIAVDELDVVSVQPGQKVTIAVDALPEAEMTGEVYKIAPVGTNSGGVTTYDVELTLDAAGTGVRSGMNATGEIQTAYAESTLYVPVEALMTISNQTYVMLADGGAAMTDAMSAMAASGGRSGMRGSRQGSMPDAGDAPDMSNMPGRSGARGAGDAAGTQSTQNAQNAQEEASSSLIDTLKGYAQQAMTAVRAWLYEGVETNARQETGSLVKVEVGMQNDDYAEILSGVSEGDVVLYTASEEDGRSMFGGMGGRGGMGGMGGMPMGGF
ncbi:MAG: HlyD family efflux transporter periplasmic adaptor subunit [Clostridia bacterium]|nr:HlyD family efflux transporter periplasmic adaptor subunit [Clostridia bacterium]